MYNCIYKGLWMNDDLVLLVSYITKQKTLEKLVIHAEHGLNNGLLTDYQYYNEPEVFDNYMKLLPDYLSIHVDYIVGAEEIGNVTYIKEHK
jgi:hypothetical protein